MAVLFVVSVANPIKAARHQRSEISVVLPIVKLAALRRRSWRWNTLHLFF